MITHCHRQGQILDNGIYFYTISIEGFKPLLVDDNLKIEVIQSLQYLVNSQLVEVYGFVIMPNHVHLLWSILDKNGKESPVGSFAKYTAHRFQKYLMTNFPNKLMQYATNKRDRNFQFWKRDALAIPISTQKILEQKLAYIHNNPIAEKWRLCSNPEDYRWSSAAFYSTGRNEFSFIKHYMEV